jgi:hypothetical protein
VCRGGRLTRRCLIANDPPQETLQDPAGLTREHVLNAAIELSTKRVGASMRRLGTRRRGDVAL